MEFQQLISDGGSSSGIVRVVEEFFAPAQDALSIYPNMTMGTASHMINSCVAYEISSVEHGTESHSPTEMPEPIIQT